MLNYLRFTKERSLLLGQLTNTQLEAYADANFAPEGDRKSQSGAVFKLAGSSIGWISKKQKTVSTSTTEAEIVALSLAMSETLWLQNLLAEMGAKIRMPTRIYEDNQPVIALVTNQRNQTLIKHLDVKVRATSDYILKGQIAVEYLPSKFQVADCLTKVTNDPNMTDCILGLRNPGVCLERRFPRPDGAATEDRVRQQ